MPTYKKEVLSTLLKSRFCVPVTTEKDPFTELLKQLDKIPA
jgi:hypothetical protein